MTHKDTHIHEDGMTGKHRILMIIDPQIDFITGSLQVAGAEEAMNSLAVYIRSCVSDYSHIIVTADRHPMRHCSFIAEGGNWPPHCVADSAGAAIWPSVMDELVRNPDIVTILHKGEDANREEYSIFKNKSAADKVFDIMESISADSIDICGIAGDVCVADTIRDLIKLTDSARINVLTAFSPSIDGGKTLNGIITEYGLSQAE